MRAVVLAAGEGGRMNKYVEELPKLFLEIEERTIFEHQLDALPAVCDRVTVVLGYGFEDRDPAEVLSGQDVPDRLDIDTVVIPEWRQYDNAESCLRALEGIDDENVLVLCGNVIFDSSVAETLVRRFRAELEPAGYSAVGAYEGTQSGMTAVRWDEAGTVTDYGAIEGHQEAGMFVFNEANLDDVRSILRENRTEWFPTVLPRVPTRRVLVPESRHYEINTPEHLRAATAALPFGQAPSVSQ